MALKRHTRTRITQMNDLTGGYEFFNLELNQTINTYIRLSVCILSALTYYLVISNETVLMDFEPSIIFKVRCLLVSFGVVCYGTALGNLAKKRLAKFFFRRTQNGY